MIERSLASQVALEASAQRHAQCTRLDRMEVNVLDRLCFVRELRLVEVGDVVVFPIEDVVDRGADLVTLPEAITGFEIDQCRRGRAHAIVFDQRCLAEVPEARAAEPAARMIDREPDRRYIFDRTENAITR